MIIKLKDVLDIPNPNDYKLHFARRDTDGQEPLDVWVRSGMDEWKKWQTSRGKQDNFNEKYIFGLMNLYHEPNAWIFGGIFEVTGRTEKKYKVELTKIGKKYIGRLKIHHPYKGQRSKGLDLSKLYDEFIVKEILPEPYSGRPFSSLDDVDLSFGELEALINHENPDWKEALGNTAGIYLIADKEKKWRYVGSATSEGGIWSRWGDYAKSGHGGNGTLKAIVKEPILKYCRDHFQFTLLEYWPIGTSYKTIRPRETRWQNRLGALGKGGRKKGSKNKAKEKNAKS